MKAFADKTTCHTVTLALVLALAALLALPALAPAAITTICPPGEGVGECKEHEGLAVDWSEGEASSGRLYVADRGNDRINVFDEGGAFLFSIGEGILDEPNSVAVDNDETSAFHRYVYVTDFKKRRIVRFNPEGEEPSFFGEGEYSASEPEQTLVMLVGTGPGGEVNVVDSRVTAEKSATARLRRYEAGGGPPTFEKDIRTDPGAGSNSNGNLLGMAVNSEADLYVAHRVAGADNIICKYDEEGVLIAGFQKEGCFSKSEVRDPGSLAVDEADHLFAAVKDGSRRTITEYDPAGEVVRRFGYGALGGFLDGVTFVGEAEGLALAGGSEGPLYLSRSTSLTEERGDEVLSVPFPPPGPIAIGLTTEVVTSANATVSAEVNPEGKETTYRFEWVALATCVEDEAELGEGHCFDQAEGSGEAKLPAGTRLAEAEGLLGCPDPVSEAGEEESICLQNETEYAWRIVATNADGEGEGTVRGKDFETPDSPQVLDAWVTEAGTDGATLHAEVNPLGIAATGYLEYVSEAQFQAGEFAEATRLPLDFGDGTEPVTRSATAFPLDPGAEYRFRVVATNPLREEGDPVTSSPFAFTTLAPSGPVSCSEEGTRGGLPGARTGLAAFLPDCRAYELVSPVEKNNANVVYKREPAGHLRATLEQSSTAGSRFAYTALTPFAEPKAAPIVSHYIAEREAGEGWGTHSISSPRKRLLTDALVQFDTEFEAFSVDLCEGWLRTIADPPLASPAPAGTLNLYRRSDDLCGGPDYEPLTTATPENLEPSLYGLELQGTSADGGRAIYRANDTLPGTGAPEQPADCGIPTKEEEESGEPKVSSSNCEQRLYSRSAGGAHPAEPSRYVCFLPDKTAAESCAAGTSVKGQIAQRNRESSVQGAISADGSRVFWTTPAPGEGEIFMRDSKGTSAPADDTTTAVSEAGEALSGTSAESRWWCGSEDGSVAIYSTGGELYEFFPDGEGGGVTHEVASQFRGIAGCSEDGSVLYLASEEEIAGSGENSEEAKAVDGEPNLYRYRAAAGAGEEGSYEFVGTLLEHDIVNVKANIGPVAEEPTARLARITPDGGVLAFMSAAELTGSDAADAEHGGPDMQVFLHDAGTGELRCASCTPTGARPVSVNANRDVDTNPLWAAGKLSVWQNPLYASRELSSDGRRLFFESPNQLVARDTNGRVDVYQWEAPGKGTCTGSSPAYTERNEGCVELISSGRASQDVTFRDASPTGEDVFFATRESLLPQDYGLVDIYDARVGGGLPVPPEPAPPCEGDACQDPPAAPEFDSPASQGYAGPGNIEAGPAAGSCAPAARRARARAKRAKALRRSARARARRGNRRAARRAMRGSVRSARSARKLSRKAKRCRRARTSGRAGR